MRILALELTRDRLALLNADMKCPPREVGQALPNPSPQGEGSQDSCPLSFWERARVRVKSVPHKSIQQRLNFHQLSVKKKRLQCELDTIEPRRERIQKRLTFLESQVAELQKTPQPTEEARSPVRSSVSTAAPDKAAFKTMFLEY